MSLDVRTPTAGRPADAAARAHPPRPTTARQHVVAVLVPGRAGNDNGTPLDRLHHAVQRQTRAPDAVVSRDAPLTTAGAVRSAATEARDQPGDGADEWLWLLTADAEPRPDALERLLAATEAGPSIGIAGCKQRDAKDRTLLVETGFTTTRLGRRVTGVERGDVDQGQLDHREDVLAVSTEGMLVRRELLERLQGLDPALTGSSGGASAAALDLCRRARLAGSRVVVVPGAVVHTAADSRIDRRETAHLRLAQTPLPLLPLAVVGLLLGGLGRLLLRVGAKDPGRGLADLADTLAALARPDRVWRSRRRAAKARTQPRRTLVPLLAGHRETARWHRERWHQRRAQLARRHQPATAAMVSEPPRRDRWRAPLLVFVGLTALSLTALHRLVGPGALFGGALAPAPRSIGRLTEQLGTSWRPTGLGDAGATDPFHTVLAAASGLAAGSPRLAVTALLLAALPVAGLGAWLAAGRGTRSRALRAWAALTWVAAPALLLATGSGRLGPLLAHAVLPYVVWAVVATVQAPLLRHAWTPAAAGGLALAVVTASSPVLLLPTMLAVLAVGVARRPRALPLLWTVLPSVALLGPWLVDALDSPRALLAEPGLPLPFDVATGWQQLLGQPAAPHSWPLLDGAAAQVAPLAASGAVVLLAGVALLRGGTAGRVVRFGWLVAVLGLATALVAGRVVVGTDGTHLVHAWPGAALSLALAGFVVAAVAGADGARTRFGGHAFGWRQAGAGALAAVALLAPAAVLGVWGWQTTTDPSDTLLTRGEPPALPKVAVDAARSPDRVRTLVLAGTPDEVTATLVRGAGPGLHDVSALDSARDVTGPLLAGQPATPDSADQALEQSVGALVAGRVDPRPGLADLGVGYLLVLDGQGADQLAAGLDAVPGLARSGQSEDARAWRVVPASGQGHQGVDRPATLRILNADGAPVAVVPADAIGADTAVPAAEDGQDRLLVLAERADDDWSATLDGHDLKPVTHAGWAQAFELPAAGGHLVVDHTEPWQGVWRFAQVVVGVLTLLLAVPLPRGRAPRSGARR